MRDPQTHTISLADGRVLGYAEYGCADGLPVFYFHGFPGSRIEAELVGAEAVALGFRVIAPDRPGYGASDPLPHRALLDWPADVSALADTLALDRFAVLGVSGGGPYALACAHVLRARVRAATLVCTLGSAETASASAALAWPARAGFAIARELPWLGRALSRTGAQTLLRHAPQTFLRLLRRVAPEPDRALLADPALADSLTRSFAEAVRRSPAGVVSDLMLYTRPWGFDPADITLPVQLWHGDADRTVPVAMARQLAARIPHCRVQVIGGEAHFSLPLRQARRILKGIQSVA